MMLLSDGTVMAQNGDLNTPANRNQWYRLSPSSTGSYANGSWSNLASMSLPRLYYGSNVLPDGRVFVVGGEYTTSNTAVWTNTGEIYNPLTNTWSSIANFPQSQFGDDPTQLLPDGRVLAGYINGGQTYLYNPSTNSWSATGSKQRSDPSDEETWVKLPDNSILSYDVWTEGQGGTNHAQRYVPSSGTWVDAGNVPTALSGGSTYGNELGGAVRLPDGRIWFLGANSHTAFYNPSNNSWTAGPNIPNNGTNQLQGADDAPMAMLPDGKVLLAVDHPLHNGPTNVYEFDRSNNSFTNVTPSISGLSTSGPAYTDRMLVLPNGQVLMTTGGNRLAVYTPAGSPIGGPSVWAVLGTGTTLTMTGMTLTGLSQGASYGDDAEMDTNYPLVQYQTIGSSTVSYARTANWRSSPELPFGDLESVDFTLPSRGIYLLKAIVNGMGSRTVLSVQMTPGNDNLVIRNDPNNSADLQVVSASTVIAEVAISSIDAIEVTGDRAADTLTVSYQYGNPLPYNGLDYERGSSVNTLNVNDQTTTTNETFDLRPNVLYGPHSHNMLFVYGGPDVVNLNGGSGNNTYHVYNPTLPTATTINTGDGNDTVNIKATHGPVSVNTTDLNGGHGHAQVNVGNAGSVQNILGAVTIYNDDPSATNVTIDDSADAGNRNVTIANAGITGLAPGTIRPVVFSTGLLTLYGGTGNNSYTVSSTPANGSMILNTGDGTDTDNVQATTVPLAVNTTDLNGGHGHDQVNVGNAGSVQSILGAVTVYNDDPGATSVTIDDSADAGNRNVTIAIAGITGLAPATIRPVVFSTGLLTLYGGTGNNTYTVSSTPANGSMILNTGDGTDTDNVQATTVPLAVNTTDLNGGHGHDQVNVGNAGSVQSILGAVTVYNDDPGATNVTIDDSADAGNRNVTIAIAGITGLAPATIRPIVFSTGLLTLYGGTGNNTYTVSSTPANGSMILNTGNGNDTVNVEATTGSLDVNGGSGGSTINLSPVAHNLVNLAGLVSINGQGGTNTLNAFDQAATFSQPLATEVLYRDHLTRYDPTRRTVFTYTGVQSVNVSAGRSDNNADEFFGVAGTPLGVPVTVTNASSGSGHVDFVVGTDSDNLDGILGLLTIHGRVGGTDFLELADDGPNPQTFTVTANTVSRTGIAPIVYDNQTELLLGTSSGALATVNVQSTAMATVTFIFLGQAGDQATINAATLQNDLVAESVSAVSVTVDDSGDNMPRAATFTTDPTFLYVLNGLAASPIYLELNRPGSSMQVLGGSGGNTFNVQGLLPGATMSLDGGSGTNTLDYTGYSGSVVADLQTGVATGFSSIANIENVTGASGGGDQGFYNLLIGNGGNTLTGGFGRRNILVAGGSASTLNAGDGEDLLIGGSTIYDTDPALASWLQIAAYWAGTDDYFTRAANLTTGNGVPLLDATAVTGNGGGNTMNGNGALALIYSDGQDNITGFDPNSIIIPIAP
jgi:hypothetical protein